MMRAIPRYGVRHVPGSTATALAALKRGSGIDGPEIALFENRFAQYHDMPHAVSTSYGRMAFHYILKALNFPPGSEVIFPALTFWVVPEIARVNGLRPVFVDIDPLTYNMDPAKLEAAISPRTRAIVPTHLYGMPCDMGPILEVARQHKALVIEDCAHALGATYQGVKVGTFGHAAFFSFQMLKGLNTYGGGMAMTRDPILATAVRTLTAAEPWPSQMDVRRRILLGEIQRGLISPQGFTWGLFIAFYVNSFIGRSDLSRLFWESIRPLTPLPAPYRRRFSNAQAILGLHGLDRLDEMNAASRTNAGRLRVGLRDIPSIVTPSETASCQSVYYQYCIRVSDAAELSRRAIRKGIDIEIMHVDVCNTLPLFAESARPCPVAESTTNTLQLPVYSRLQPSDIERVLQIIREASRDLPPVMMAGLYNVMT